jgi:hypothetical protein
MRVQNRFVRVDIVVVHVMQVKENTTKQTREKREDRIGGGQTAHRVIQRESAGEVNCASVASQFECKPYSHGNQPDGKAWTATRG